MSVDAKLLGAVAFGIFKASFHEDDPDTLVREKWNEWEDDRTMAIRRARFAIRSYEQHIAQHRRPA
jgi:hypothetical protein